MVVDDDGLVGLVVVMMLELTIDKVVSGGDGLGFNRGRAVFVPWTAPGDRVLVSVVREHRDYQVAELVKILESGPHRQEPVCPVYYRIEEEGAFCGPCGGCRLLHLDRIGVSQAKSGMITEALRRIGGLDSAVGDWVSWGDAFGYRRRVGLKLRWLGDRGVVGFYQPGSHRVVDLEGCPVLHPALRPLPAWLRLLLAELEAPEKVPQVDGLSGESGVGVVFHVLERPSVRDEACLLDFAERHGLIQLWIQTGRKGSLQPLMRRQPLQYTVDGFTLQFEPGDFTQVNFEQNRILVEQALLLAGEGGTVWDLFCGIGNFALPLTRRWDRVVGVEGYGPALVRAAGNARFHKLSSIVWRDADLFRADVVQSLFVDGAGVTAALLDPPREGAAAVCKALARSQVARVVYVSCNPTTFARDAAILVHQGWRLVSVRPLEMFPGTQHVELLAEFVRG